MSRRRLPILVALAVAVALLAAGCGSDDSGTDAAGGLSDLTTQPSTAPPTTAVAVPPQGLGNGDSGDAVRAVEARLAELHFEVVAVDGVFDVDNTYAVQAFQKLAGLPTHSYREHRWIV